MKPREFIKPGATLALLGLMTWLAPLAPIDPWNLVSPKKFASMILTLAVIQAFSSVLERYLGTRMGAMVAGFLGGLISSTATTASLARRSKLGSGGRQSGGILTFLSATGAMLVEGCALVIAGASEVRAAHLIVFVGPLLATVAMIYGHYRTATDRRGMPQDATFQILPILKLSVFIVVILSISKVVQRFFGENGLLVVTSLVSLFEIHGSVIANVQMHELGNASAKLLSTLLVISIGASYISKVFLIWILGSARLRTQALKCTLVLFLSLAISWMISTGVS